jgi:D-arabinose 5-phosphate isomerase GutQ
MSALQICQMNVLILQVCEIDHRCVYLSDVQLIISESGASVLILTILHDKEANVPIVDIVLGIRSSLNTTDRSGPNSDINVDSD